MTTTSSGHTVIAIDGPSGVGKSTAAQRLAQRLGYCYVDSGALYRAVGWIVISAAVPLDATAAIVERLRRTPIDVTFEAGQSAVWVQGENVTSQLRGETVGAAASAVATQPAVRQAITAQLRRLRCQADLVMEGRDIGTIVFPDAPVKFFLDASLEVRTQRRYHEMQAAGQATTLEHVQQAVAARDRQDRTRAVAPLLPADDAHVVDTTDLSIDDVVQVMLSEIYSQRVQGNEYV